MTISVTSAEIIEDVPQRDGRRWIVQRFFYSDGTYFDRRFMAGEDYDGKADIPIALERESAALIERNAMEAAQLIEAKAERIAMAEEVLKIDAPEKLAAEVSR